MTEKRNHWALLALIAAAISVAAGCEQTQAEKHAQRQVRTQIEAETSAALKRLRTECVEAGGNPIVTSAPNIYGTHACEFDNSDGSFNAVGRAVGPSCDGSPVKFDVFKVDNGDGHPVWNTDALPVRHAPETRAQTGVSCG